MAGELFKRMAGIEMLHVPYRGAGPSLADLIAGRIDLQFASGVALELIKSGQVRGLGVSSAKRNAAAAELPTVAEAGVPGFEVSSWFAFFAPARTPPDIIKSRLEQLGLAVIGSSTQDLASHLQSEITKWGAVIKDAGIRVDG